MKGQMGNCSTVFFHYDGWALLPAFVNVPDNWSALTAEYIAWLDRAHEVMLPLYELCQGGGGTLSDDNDRILADFLDEAQNGLYELMLAADAMK